MNYHVGETVLSLQKTTLIPGGSESLVYTTLSGGIGILVPFTSHEVGPGTRDPADPGASHPLTSLFCCRTTTSSSTWRCTCAPSSPPCVAETTSASAPTTSRSRLVPGGVAHLRPHLDTHLSPVLVQNVIDGDLCEQFNSMDPHRQKSLAEELDRTPPEVSKKLEDIRTRYAF